ncbi:MAG: polyprenyl synthetase family protein [Prevotella sp.]|nr:polyprenyl synthetase family protein [Prevotella sp.]
MQTPEELRLLVNNYFKQLPYERQPRSLYDPIRYVLSLGGKRLRPVLMLMAYNMYREHPETIIEQAIGLETYHNYTLLHDDLMDNAPMRRGQPTVHLKWDANTAILSGDAMFVLAYQHMANGLKEKLPEVISLFTETALGIGDGQQFDMDFEQRNDVCEDEYIEMIRLKTSILLACALKMGAILADAPQADADNLYRFGEHIGLAFQLQDDYLDVYGDPKVFGKAIGGDILEGKKTFMLINALAHADEAQRKTLEQWLERSPREGTPEAQEKIQAVTSLYNQIGIDRMAQEKIAWYFEQSRQYIEAVQLPAERKRFLIDYAQQMMQRSY